MFKIKFKKEKKNRETTSNTNGYLFKKLLHFYTLFIFGNGEGIVLTQPHRIGGPLQALALKIQFSNHSESYPRANIVSTFIFDANIKLLNYIQRGSRVCVKKFKFFHIIHVVCGRKYLIFTTFYPTWYETSAN